MRSGWKRVRLGDHIATQKGYAFKSKWYTDSGRPIVKVSDFTADSVDISSLVSIPEEIAASYLRYELSEDDVVIQTVGSWPSNPQSVVGRAIRVPHDAGGALLNQNAVKIIPGIEIDNSYLFYLLRSEFFKEYIVGTAQGAASQASITLDSIRYFAFDLPPRNVQSQITAILSAYDDLIENNLRRIKILEEIAQNLYREWFVKFRFPGHEQVRMVDSPLGKIPEGWEVRNLLDVAEVTYGFAFKSKGFNTEGKGKPVVRIRDVLAGRADTFSEEEPGDKYKVRNGDILVGMDGDFHMGFWTGGDAWLVQRVARFQSKGKMSQYLLFLGIRKPIQHFNATITGTTVAHLGHKHIKTIELAYPPAEMLKRTALMLEPMLGEILNLRLRNQNLRQTRDLLLPKLISGEIDVSELDIATDKEAA
jgi:type I restriction enzyme S subunit